VNHLQLSFFGPRIGQCKDALKFSFKKEKAAKKQTCFSLALLQKC